MVKITLEDGLHASNIIAGVWYDWGGANRGAGRRVGVANGVFPAGCKWRDVQHDGAEKEFWAVEGYEYWDEVRQRWTSKRPPGCIFQGFAGSEGCATMPYKSYIVSWSQWLHACFCNDTIVRCMHRAHVNT